MRKFVAGTLIVGIWGTALAFGGMELLLFAVVEILILLSAVCSIWGGLTQDFRLRFPWRGPALLGLYLLVQLFLVPTASPNPDHLLHWLTYGSAFYLCVWVGREENTRNAILCALIGLGLFEALYGLVQYLTGWQQIFTYVKVHYRAEATGTYINHNHFAGLLEMILPLVLAQALSQAKRTPAGGNFAEGNPGTGLGGRAQAQKAVLWLFLGVLVFTALLFSHSRMGILASLGGLGILLTLWASARWKRRSKPLLALVLLFSLGVLTLGLWIGIGPIIERYAALEREYALTHLGFGRLAVWGDTLRLIESHFWFGVGLGRFADSYTQVQTAHLGQFVDYAHNDYLQLSAELGVIGATMLFASIAWAVRRTWQAARNPAQNSASFAALGITGGVVAILLHALADFNFYIPANALVFSVLLGLGFSTAAGAELGSSDKPLDPANR